jgi:hypothetical protein
MPSLTITNENANLIATWIKTRGGVAVWKSVDLSDPGKEMLTPADKLQKPHWKMANEPAYIIKEAKDITVITAKELKRFHVATRMSGNGMSIKCTPASSRRIEDAVAKAGEGAYYVFDYEDEKNCVIMVPDKTVSLTEYMETTK